MAEPATIPAPTSFEEPYEVAWIERKTPTIVELELRPLNREHGLEANRLYSRWRG